MSLDIENHLNKLDLADKIPQQRTKSKEGQKHFAKLADFGKITKISSGAHGVVYLGNDEKSNPVALKVNSHAHHVKKATAEFNVSFDLNNPYIMKTYDLYHEDDKSILILEHIEGEELFDTVEDFDESGYDLRSVIRDIALGLQYLKSKQIIHRDLKPENVMITREGKIKIIDFSCATRFDPKNRPSDTVGTVTFLSPDVARCVLTKNPTVTYDYAVDVWGLGSIAYFLSTSGNAPFNPRGIRGLREQLQAIINNSIPYPGYWTDQQVDLMSRMFDKNPDTRITIEEVLEHPFLR
jgi:serine/threonine protein kinase